MVGPRQSILAAVFMGLTLMTCGCVTTAGILSQGDTSSFAQNNASCPMCANGGGQVGCSSCGMGNIRQAGYCGGAEGGSAPGPIPTELQRTSLPPYTVAPPDILFIDALRMIPKPPYHIEALETLIIDVSNTLPNQPIKGTYTVSPEGTIALGYGYPNVRVAGSTLEEAQRDITQQLRKSLANPQVSVSLAQFRGAVQVRGEHLVRPDGSISLGTFGSVYVNGLNLAQVKWVVEKHLSQFLLDPLVSVDVFAYNSKVYYVIIDGAGFGQQIFRRPITGNETVLDAISSVQGLAPCSSKRRIWLARPAPAGAPYNQVMPIDWNAVTEAGSTATNYQVFPGDRIYVHSNPIICFSNRLSQVLNPIEQLMGATFLGVNTVLGFQAVNHPGATPFVP